MCLRKCGEPKFGQVEKLILTETCAGERPEGVSWGFYMAVFPETSDILV